MGVTITGASYSTTLAIVSAGVAPLLWSPLSNVYGRRPVYIYSSIIGIVPGAGCAVTTRWQNLLIARVFAGMGTSAGMGIGASVVSDMYFMHERGKYVTNVYQEYRMLMIRQIHGYRRCIVSK